MGGIKKCIFLIEKKKKSLKVPSIAVDIWIYFLPDFIDFYGEKKCFLMQGCNHTHLQWFMLSFAPSGGGRKDA